MKILLAEDSRTVIAYLEAIFRRTPDVTLLPVAHDGASAVEAACALRPDLILMDLMLPVLDGIEAIRQIMALAPCPIVVLSEHIATPQGDRTFEALAAGAVDVLAKPAGVQPKQAAEFAERLISTVRLMVTAHVVRRPVRTGPASAGSSSPWRGRFELVAIGASVGGPQLLWELLRQLPAPFPLPIVICQHILAGFEQGLAAWLSRTHHAVRVAAPGDRLQAGRVLLAPSERHLALRGGSCEYVDPAERSPERPRDRQMTPSVDVLFESIAESIGRRCVALLLTGMGEDGARGLHELRKRGALTVTQNGESCVVDGMPAAARGLGAAELELTPAGMVKLLLQVGTP